MKRVINDFKSVSSELMENTIPTVDVMIELNRTIVELQNAESDEELQACIDNFYNRVDSWQIVVAQPQDTLVWMQTPMKYYEVKKEYSFTDRLKILYNEGIWINHEVTEKYAEITSNTKVPMEIPLDPLTYSFAKDNKVERFYFTLFSLARDIIEAMIREKTSEVAVYKKPYGIVAMNRVNYWVDELEKETKVDTKHLKESLTTISFSDLIKNAKLTKAKAVISKRKDDKNE